MLQKFQARLPGELDRIQQAVSGRDFATLRAASHTLCGTAGNLAASRLHRIASDLESLARRQRSEEIEACIVDLAEEAGRLIVEIDAIMEEWLPQLAV
jgi:HPt (histidine-containing phosphotransfer) domain-containing protein